MTDFDRFLTSFNKTPEDAKRLDRIKEFTKTSGLQKAIDEAADRKDRAKMQALSLAAFLSLHSVQSLLHDKNAPGAYAALQTFLSITVPHLFNPNSDGISLMDWATDIATADFAALHRTSNLK